MVSVKIDFMKKDFFWIVMLIVFVGISLVYAYGGNQPSVMGHSAGELDLSAGVNGDAIFNGNVGIGTSNPGSMRLAIEGSSAGVFNGLTIKNTDTTAGATSYFGMPVFNGAPGFSIQQSTNAAGPVGWAIGAYDVLLSTGQGGSYMHFATSNEDEPDMTINRFGNVGIGTTNPQATLDVNGNIKANNYLSSDGTIGYTGQVRLEEYGCDNPTYFIVKQGIIVGLGGSSTTGCA